MDDFDERAMCDDNEDIYAVLPDSDSADFFDLPEYAVAKRVCVRLNEKKGDMANIVEVIDDKEIDCQAIEVLGPEGSITWSFLGNPANKFPIQPFLTLHLRNFDKFLSFEVLVLDALKKKRLFKVSNRRSHTVISTERWSDPQSDLSEDVSVCELPLNIGSGWQMTRLNLSDLCRNAFGTENPVALSITVRGNCRVAKIFFTMKPMSDAEMPPHLRCIA